MLIHSWSIPAGDTCPGKTEICAQLCYAKTGHFVTSTVQDAHHRNWRQAAAKRFADNMIADIHRTYARVVRIHAAGDFYSVAYTRAWLKIIKACPDVQFYAYTRSWRDHAILPWLKRLAKQPNMALWFSCDRETGAPRDRKIPRAWMMVNDQDLPPYAVDLIFRDQHQTVLKKVVGAIVCPYENGTDIPITCSQCQICFKEQLWEHLFRKKTKNIGAN